MSAPELSGILMESEQLSLCPPSLHPHPHPHPDPALQALLAPCLRQSHQLSAAVLLHLVSASHTVCQPVTLSVSQSHQVSTSHTRCQLVTPSVSQSHRVSAITPCISQSHRVSASHTVCQPVTPSVSHVYVTIRKMYLYISVSEIS